MLFACKNFKHRKMIKEKNIGYYIADRTCIKSQIVHHDSKAHIVNIIFVHKIYLNKYSWIMPHT